MRPRRLIATVIFLAGVVAAVNIFYPKIGKTLTGLFKKPPNNNQILGETAKSLNNILGIKDVGQEEKILNNIKDLPSQIYKEQAVQEVTQKINEVVNQKVEEVKKIPEQQLDQAKKDLKKQIYQEVCRNWLNGE